MSKKRYIKAMSLFDRVIQKQILQGDNIMSSDLTFTTGTGINSSPFVLNGTTKDVSNDSFFNDAVVRAIKSGDYCVSTKIPNNYLKVFASDYINRYISKYGKTPVAYAKEIIPEVTDVEVINNCVTILTFADGTKEKAVLDKQDIFNLEQGISICLTKKLLSQLTFGNGNKTYNKLIKSTTKKYFAKLDAIEEKKKAEEQKKKKYAKIAAKKAKRKEKQKEARINEQAEAYRRALQSISTSDSTE